MERPERRTGGVMTIGRVAKAAGVNIDTIRFYERRRLVRPDSRRASGYRVYRPDAVRRLRFIRRAQALGFSLGEIAALLRLRAVGGRRCDRVCERAGGHLRAVKGKIARLREIEGALESLIRACRRGAGTGDCAILDSLERGPDGNPSTASAPAGTPARIDTEGGVP
jgi:DNA-binding transcriptional MerR regulator